MGSSLPLVSEYLLAAPTLLPILLGKRVKITSFTQNILPVKNLHYEPILLPKIHSHMNLKIPEIKYTASLPKLSRLLQLRKSGFYIIYQGNRNLQLMMSRQDSVYMIFLYSPNGLEK